MVQIKKLKCQVDPPMKQSGLYINQYMGGFYSKVRNLLFLRELFQY